MTDKEKNDRALEVALADYERKLEQKREIESYYDSKREELNLKKTDRFLKYLDDPGPFFSREVLYAHNDFETVLKAIADETEWAIVSGLNPSGPLHFGHKAMMDVLLWFQRTYRARVYIPITNDETYVVGKADSLRKSRQIAYEFVIPSIIALGFDPALTHIFVHSDYPSLTNLAMFLGKYTTYNTVRGLFGWSGSENIGTVFYMGALQMASIIMPQLPEFGGPKPVLVPVGIDQHPYIALSRDVAKRLRLIQPSEVIWKFLMGLKGPDKKMSSSVPDSAIWLTDTPQEAARKIKRAYTGGSSLASVHRERGGIPEVCSIFSLIAFNFLSDDAFDALRDDYSSGRLLSGDLKARAIELVSDFLSDHQRAREEAKGRIEEFLLKTPIRTPLEADVIPAAVLEEERDGHTT
ncbi:MAG: tryptophan--tRNA ligase [Chloroflexi bacterium]|nr:tryptophan--tRNA ligase [Chloroflexota bacterium]